MVATIINYGRNWRPPKVFKIGGRQKSLSLAAANSF